MSSSSPTPTLVLRSRQTAPFGRGGDLYEAVQDVKGRVSILIADVCGNGVAAAAVIPELRLVARAFLRNSGSPGQVLADMNDWLIRVKQLDRFVTAVALRIDVGTGCTEIASAGHLGPFLRRASGRAQALPMPVGVVLGVLAKQAYLETVVELGPGETLVLATDGITDPLASTGDLLGELAFASRIEAVHAATAESICSALIKAEQPGGNNGYDATVVVLQLEDHSRSRAIEGAV